MRWIRRVLGMVVMAVGWSFAAHAQGEWDQKTIHFSFVQTPLDDALAELERSFGLSFSYDPKLVEGIAVTAQTRGDTTLKEALGILLSETDLAFSFNPIAIIIKPGLTTLYFKIKGRVIDVDTRESLPDAYINAGKDGRYQITNKDGFFTITGSGTRSITLCAQHLGYRKACVTVPLDAFQDLVEIAMHSEPWVLDTTIVDPGWDEVIDIDPMASGAVLLHPGRLTNLPSLGEPDIFRTVQMVTFGGADETSAGLNIRGGTSEQNLVLFDDFTVYHQDHFFGVFSAFNPEVVKSVKVLKSGYGAKYGGRVSGVVDITGKDGNRSKVSGSVSANMLSTSGALEVPIGKKVSILVGGRRAYTDWFQTPVYENLFEKIGDDQSFLRVNGSERSISQASTPEFHFNDLNFKLSYQPTQKDVVSLAYYQGRDYLDASSNPSDTILLNFANGTSQAAYIRYDFNDRTKWGNTAYSTKWSRQWNKRVFTKMSLGRSDFTSRYSLNQSARITSPSGLLDIDFADITEDNSVRDLTLNLQWSYLIGSFASLSAGVQHTSLEIDYISEYEDASFQGFVHDIRQRGETLGGFVEMQAWSGKRMLIVAGIRTDLFSQTNRWYPAPRLSLAYEFGQRRNFIVKAAYGRYYQFVSRAEFSDSYGLNRDFWTLTDQEHVPVLQSDHVTLGTNYSKGHFNIDLEAYYKYTDGLIIYQSRYDQPNVELRSYEGFFAFGDAHAYGIEMLSRYRKGGYTMWVGYALSKVIQQFDGLNAGEAFAASHDRPHQFNMMQQLQWKEHWVFSTNFIMASGTPYSSPVWVYEIDPFIGDGESFTMLDIGRRNANRLPLYHRLDVAATYNFELGKVLKGKIGLSAINVYNRKNIRNRLFQNLGQSGQTEPTWRVSEIRLLGFIPNFFLYLKF